MSPTLREFRRRYLPAIAAWDFIGEAADNVSWDFPAKPYDQEKRARGADTPGLTTKRR